MTKYEKLKKFQLLNSTPILVACANALKPPSCKYVIGTRGGTGRRQYVDTLASRLGLSSDVTHESARWPMTSASAEACIEAIEAWSETINIAILHDHGIINLGALAQAYNPLTNPLLHPAN